jgi:ATP-dependent DNA helicase DinG
VWQSLPPFRRTREAQVVIDFFKGEAPADAAPESVE